MVYTHFNFLKTYVKSVIYHSKNAQILKYRPTLRQMGKLDFWNVWTLKRKDRKLCRWEVYEHCITSFIKGIKNERQLLWSKLNLSSLDSKHTQIANLVKINQRT